MLTLGVTRLLRQVAKHQDPLVLDVEMHIRVVLLLLAIFGCHNSIPGKDHRGRLNLAGLGKRQRSPLLVQLIRVAIFGQRIIRAELSTGREIKRLKPAAVITSGLQSEIVKISCNVSGRLALAGRACHPAFQCRVAKVVHVFHQIEFAEVSSGFGCVGLSQLLSFRVDGGCGCSIDSQCLSRRLMVPLGDKNLRRLVAGPVRSPSQGIAVW